MVEAQLRHQRNVLRIGIAVGPRGRVVVADCANHSDALMPCRRCCARAKAFRTSAPRSCAAAGTASANTIAMKPIEKRTLNPPTDQLEPTISCRARAQNGCATRQAGAQCQHPLESRLESMPRAVLQFIRGIFRAVQGGFFLRKKPLSGCGFVFTATGEPL